MSIDEALRLFTIRDTAAEKKLAVKKLIDEKVIKAIAYQKIDNINGAISMLGIDNKVIVSLIVRNYDPTVHDFVYQSTTERYGELWEYPCT